MSDDARSTLTRLCAERGESLAGLSRLLGRNDAYIQQYLRKGTPRRLPERDRRADHDRATEPDGQRPPRHRDPGPRRGSERQQAAANTSPAG